MSTFADNPKNLPDPMKSQHTNDGLFQHRVCKTGKNKQNVSILPKFTIKYLSHCIILSTFATNFEKCIYIAMERIDKLDKKIMEIISVNARIPFKDVAVECGVSRAAIHQRVQRLIDTNVITGSGYHVNPKSLGYSTCTFVGLKLEKGSMYKSVVEEIAKIPEVVECHCTTGQYTLFLKMYARDNSQLMDILNNKIQAIHGVDSTETLISLDQSIKKAVPIVADEEDTN